MKLRRLLSSGLLLLLWWSGIMLARAQSAPEIDQIVPDHVPAGAANTPIAVFGKNLSGSIVFNGSSLSTTVVSSTELTATVPSTSLAAIGSFGVHVGASNTLRFRVLTPLVPIDHTVPSQFPTAVNTPISVFGSNFDSSSTILFDWQPIATTFVSANELTGTVPSGLITSTQTHHILVYAGAFTAGSITTLSNLTVIGTDQPQLSLSNVVIGSSMTGTVTARALQGSVTLATPFQAVTGPNAGDFSVTGGSCANGKVLPTGSACNAQVTVTPAALPTPPPGWLPNNSYALNFEIVDNANRIPNAIAHLQKATTAGISGALSPGSGTQAGVIFISALDDAGTGYAVDDTFTVDGGATLATGHITSIGGGGAVTGIALDLPGTGYTTGTHTATTATSGSGAGMTADISAANLGPWNESGGTSADGSATWTDQGAYVVSANETATLAINSNAANNPQSVPLNVTKTYPAIGYAALRIGSAALNPAGYDFGSVTQSTPTSRTITLINGGRAYLNLATPFYTITGTNAADFALSGGTCANGQFLNNGSGLTNSPGQSCAFNLTFTPSTTAAETAMLTFNWTSIGGTVGSATQILTGTGHAAATKIHLAWTASTSGSVTGYKVYRGTQTGGPYTLLASPGNVTSYDDTTPVHGNTYCYVITTVGANPPYNAESSYGAESCATF